jgi:hypothetical protein
MIKDDSVNKCNSIVVLQIEVSFVKTTKQLVVKENFIKIINQLSVVLIQVVLIARILFMVILLITNLFVN